MEISKNNFVIHPNKATRLSKTLSRFSNLDPKLTQQLVQRKQLLMAIKNAQSRNPSIDESHSNVSTRQIQPRQKIRQRRMSSQVKQRQILKSVENEKSRRNSSIDNKSLPKPRSSFSVAVFKKQNLLLQPNRLSLQQKEPPEKTPIRIIQLLKGSKTKENSNQKRILSEDYKNQNSDFHKDQKPRNSQLFKSDNFQHRERSPYLRLKKQLCLSTQNDDREVSCEINDFLNKIKLYKLKKMDIFSGLTSISVQYQNQDQEISKFDKQVQASQSQAQFFEFLTYKRKKHQFEFELQKAFKELQALVQDRKQCHERTMKMELIYTEPPINQRQKRIFELKKDIELYQNKIMTQVYRKEKQSSTIFDKLSQIESTLTSSLKKIESMSKNYLKQFREIFEKHGEQKHARATQRIETLYSTLIKEIHSNVTHLLSQLKKEMQTNSEEKQEAKQFKYCLSQYMKCIKQEKTLLRNCFDHIKYMPELFYKLFGDQLNQNQLKNQIVDEAVPKQKELPKCIRCYNSERKMSLIVQKNILIQSVLKVVDQMVN